MMKKSRKVYKALVQNVSRGVRVTTVSPVVRFVLKPKN